MKRKHGIEKFPQILEAIQSGKYTVREPEDKKKYVQPTTWKLFRFIFDENDVLLADHFICSQCYAIYNLNLSKSGQSLKRHAEKCVVPTGSTTISNFFLPELHATKRSKFDKEDREIVRDAAIRFVVKDMRPVSSINGEGMMTLLSKMTYIGAKYGYISEERLPDTKLIPSRQTVKLSYRIRNRCIVIRSRDRNIFIIFSQTRRYIADSAETVRNQMKSIIRNEFKNYGGSISLDCWTDKSRRATFFGLTIHYLSIENGRLVSNDRVLVIRELAVEKKDGNFLKEKVIEYVNEFDLEEFIENNLVFVSDRGSNIVKALNSFQHINCFSHMIHNTTEKLLEKNRAVSAVTGIVKYFKSSGHNALFQTTLKSFVSTRWNSVYMMLESFIKR